MERRASLLLLIILIGFSLSFAEADCPSDSADWEGPQPCIDVPELGLAFVFVIALLSVAIIALATMLGNSFQSPEITAWSKTELRELLVGAILVVIVWAVVAGTDTMVSAIFLNTGEESLVDLGDSALNPLLDYLEILYGKVADAYLSVGVLQGTSYYSVLAPAWWVYFAFGTSPGYGTSILLGPLSTAANNLTIQILTIKAVQQFMGYISIVVPSFLLPISLAFRLFPFTRSLGNTLIGICLGALLIVPISLMVVGDLFEMASNPPEDTSAGFAYMNGDSGVLATSFKLEDMSPSRPLYDVGGLIMDLVCKNVILREFTTLGELIWGIVYGIINISSCGYPPFLYPICFAQKFIEFILVKWPEIMFYAELTMASLMIPVMIGNMVSGSNVDPSLAAVNNVLLPAVAEATAFSVLSFVVIAFITIGGITAISSALGGEHIIYGITRFV